MSARDHLNIKLRKKVQICLHFYFKYDELTLFFLKDNVLYKLFILHL
jgi:hypothetical protein